MASSNNIADQIANAVQNAVDSKNFSNLQSSIERAVDTAAQSIGRGIAQVSDGIRQGQDQYARIQEEKHRAEQMEALYAKPSGTRGGGVALIAFGCCIGVPLLAAGGLFALVGSAAAIPLIAAGAIISAGLSFAGSRQVKLASRFERYRNVIGLRESCTIGELASTCAESPEATQANVKKMLAKGLFKQAALDENEGLLLMTGDAYREHEQKRAQALSLRRQRELVQPARKADDDKTGPTPTQALLLERGEAFIAEIRAGNDAIPDEGISRTLDQIEHVVRAIVDVATENPEVTDDLGQLMDYYLPTTVKLLDAYRELDSQPVQGESIRQSKREIEGALESLNSAFEKLLDSLFRDMAIDVSSDISVLHTVLAQEGLVASPFEKAASSTTHQQPR